MSNGLIVVTGASGFIAKHIVLQLLDQGYHVRATVRSPARQSELRAAIERHAHVSTDLDRRLSFALLDLEKDDGWDNALAGADALIHTASPFPLVQPKDENAIIRPAVEGTLRALRAAKKAGVTRAVLTSSVVAVALAKRNGKTILDESDWSEITDPRATAYAKSKTLAERAAWNFVEAEAPEMKLTVINPGLVIGAPLDTVFGTSLRVIQRLLKAKDPMLPNFGFPVVDVRDIAAIHVACLSRPETAGKRYLGGDEFLWFPEMASILKAAFPERHIVTRRAPNAIVRFLALFDNEIRSVVQVLDDRVDVTAERARRDMGLTFRPASEAVISAGRFLIENKLV
ncbi:MAG: aldehyde reductase [Hyphomicrobium sp.]|jgi:dihydroflavonol-4-reductase